MTTIELFGNRFGEDARKTIRQDAFNCSLGKAHFQRVIHFAVEYWSTSDGSNGYGKTIFTTLLVALMLLLR